MEKAELVTLKYSNQSLTQQTNQQEQDQNWINVSYHNKNTRESTTFKNMLYCKDPENLLKLEYSEEEFIKRLVGLNNLTNQ